MNAYIKILEESVRQGLPEHYKTDILKHDKERLIKHRPAVFVFGLRQCGTELYLYCGCADWAEAVIHNNPKALWYVYIAALDRLIPIDADHVVTTVKALPKFNRE